MDPSVSAEQSAPAAQAPRADPSARWPSVALTPRGWKRFAMRHPWIFRDDLVDIRAESGDLATVLDGTGRELGRGFVSGVSKIALRIVSWKPGAIDEEKLLAERLAKAAERRPRRDRDEGERLVAAEADDLPGLVVDRYADVICVQHAIPYWDRRRAMVARALVAAHSPRAIVARDEFTARALEGLERRVDVLHGDDPGPVEIREGSARFVIDPKHGQKTGFFLDQRESRERIEHFVRGTVLDVFTGDGGFGIHAALAGASRVVAVDSAEPALARARANAERNGVADRCEWVRGMAFDQLRDRAKAGERFDLVVLDPPAFAKNRGEVESALRGYVEINSRAMRLVAPGGYLATFSCSYHLTEELFHGVLHQAAIDCGRRVELVERRLQSHDHPVVVTHPESMYLKGAILRIES